MTRLLVVGDALLDVDIEGSADRLSPDAPVPVITAEEHRPRPGGAGLAAVLAARDGADVTLVTALGDDEDGRRLRALLADEGVAVHDLGRDGDTVSKTRILAGGRPVARLDRGTPGVPHDLADSAAVGDHDAVLVADYGLGVSAAEGVRAFLSARLAAGVPVVWDPHPKGSEPVAGITLVTPNLKEARASAGDGPEGEKAVPAACRAGEELAGRWEAAHVCVTIGEGGAVLTAPGAAPLVVGPPRVATGDPCGAGDRFASRLALAVGDGKAPEDAVRAAVAAAAAFVDAGGARAAGGLPVQPAAPSGPAASVTRESAALELVERVRARGGTVVATGGCFDLLHAGHVESLQAARELGDALVVCLNSDDSVRRLKGPERPIIREEDRAAVLGALACVDAVAVFAEDTPVALLERLRPDLFVKGGDYRPEELPETPVLARWGGRVVTVPLKAGRSTTSILQEVRRVA
ncbi:D-glycero-beta-D-manno-heptose 1-phosphate adenylyltransferase [Patulibacter sp. SYSU D01012]|uniref:D-glycero-beta-D-manno-heptose 1-phosphate adenylyltransferase n=1 Tax=Patulibacter sp. SYSU D01012 TaxID=2817381 RepID=UPI001B3055C3|nr:D-glycero-beta-D-manno-heptose 1-phosphate adenylyltransferase [Patulibacter sp. SYSU D01012]